MKSLCAFIENMSASKRAENLKLVIQYFSGDDSFLGPDLSQLCLEFSGCLKVGKKSLVFVTFRVPSYKGRLMKRIALEHFQAAEGNKSSLPKFDA